MRGRSAAGASPRCARRATRSALVSARSCVFVWLAFSPASTAKAGANEPVPAVWIASESGVRISRWLRAAVSARTRGCTTPPGAAVRASPNAALPSWDASAFRSRAPSARPGPGGSWAAVSVALRSRMWLRSTLTARPEQREQRMVEFVAGREHAVELGERRARGVRPGGEAHVIAHQADRERAPPVARARGRVQRKHVERDRVARLELPTEDRERRAV